MQRDAATLLNLPAQSSRRRGCISSHSFFSNAFAPFGFLFLLRRLKVTDRLRTGLSTTEKTGPVLSADRPFLHQSWK
eukprot:6203319-Pleurochrysis_carterae.AAC.1